MPLIGLKQKERSCFFWQSLNFNFIGGYNWQPPTDAEMKIIQARRERSDKISSIMGEYLLKGYKMLSAVCDVCEVCTSKFSLTCMF